VLGEISLDILGVVADITLRIAVQSDLRELEYSRSEQEALQPETE